MQIYKINNIENYLCRYEQILNDMANEMLSVKFCDNITINFITCMVPHHRAAIYMCNNLLKYSNCEPLINISKNIIDMQTIGIEQMCEIKNTTPIFSNLYSDVVCYIDKYCYITNNMVNKMMKSCKSLNVNIDFISEMIPHHEGAIYMCNNLLKYNIDPRLKQVANSIISEQSNGVEQLKRVYENICGFN